MGGVRRVGHFLAVPLKTAMTFQSSQCTVPFILEQIVSAVKRLFLRFYIHMLSGNRQLPPPSVSKWCCCCRKYRLDCFSFYFQKHGTKHEFIY